MRTSVPWRRGGLTAALASAALALAPSAVAAADTSITSSPPREIASSLVFFVVEGTAGAVGFECSFDDRPFLPCPTRVRYSGLTVGGHVFRVRAVDADGTVDETPAQHAFAVVTPPPPPPTRFALSHGTLTRWAPIVVATKVRAAPSLGGRVLTRLATRTPERTSNLVVVLERHADARGRLWVRVRLPVLPNNLTGWVPRGALGGYRAVYSRLVIDRDAQTATLYRFGKAVFRAHVGVGARSSPTPRGEFYVRVRIDSLDPFYGPVAFGTSGRSYVRTDWPGGGFVGIHGTSSPELLPGRVSNGCVRLRNEDVLRLAALLRVGTPVTIR